MKLRGAQFGQYNLQTKNKNHSLKDYPAAEFKPPWAWDLQELIYSRPPFEKMCRP